MDSLHRNNFDFLRMMMAVVVFFGHIGELSDEPRLFFFKKSPVEVAVFVFFIISGFLISKSYERSSSLKSYFEKRIRRIFPAYYLVVLLCTFLLFLMSTLPFSDYFKNMQTWKYLGWNSVFMNFKAPNLPGVFGGKAVNGALWTIKIELMFYALVPVIFLLFGKDQRRRNVSLGLLYVLSVCYLNYFVMIGKPQISRQILGTLSYFIGGMLVNFNLEKFIKYKNFLAAIGLIFCLIDYFGHFIALSPIGISFLAMYIVFSFKFLSNFGKFGDFTYGIYIFHFPIIHLVREFGFFRHSPFVATFFTFIIVIFVGIMSWNFVEKPFLNRRR